MKDIILRFWKPQNVFLIFDFFKILVLKNSSQGYKREYSTYIDRLNLAKLLKYVGEVLLSGLFVHLAHPQSCAAH